MKIRNDFVTNSSSSSFVIAIKEDELSKDAKIFLDAILGCSWEDTNSADVIDINNKDDMEYFDEEEIDEIKELIKNNWKVYRKYVSYDDACINEIIKTLNEELPSFKFVCDEY